MSEEFKICELYKDGRCQVLQKNVTHKVEYMGSIGTVCKDKLGECLCGWYPRYAINPEIIDVEPQEKEINDIKVHKHGQFDYWHPVSKVHKME